MTACALLAVLRLRPSPRFSFARTEQENSSSRSESRICGSSMSALSRTRSLSLDRQFEVGAILWIKTTGVVEINF
jgi:hypothetical protein